MNYDTIKKEIISVGAKVVGVGLGIALGVSIGGYIPKSESIKPSVVITTYEDANGNGLYDTVIREFPDGTITKKKLGWVSYDGVGHFREVTEDDLKAQNPIGLEKIVINQ